MAQTTTPNGLARELSGKGRTVTAKMVRTVARQSLARFDKTKHPAYQSHEYSAVEVKSLRALFAGRGTRKVKSGQASKATPRKSTRVTRKASGDAAE